MTSYILFACDILCLSCSLRLYTAAIREVAVSRVTTCLQKKKAEPDMEKTYVVKREVGVLWDSGMERSGGQMQSGFPSLGRFSV